MRVVILGTGTGVGKTFVTAALGAALRSGQSVLALKPIETGVEPGVGGDAARIALGAGHAPALSPWRYRRGVSPHLAARQESNPVDLDKVADWVREQEQSRPPGQAHQQHITLIESAGGALTPLAPGTTNVDLAQALGPALWLLVAPDALGVLNDVGAMLRALPRPPDALVLSSSRPADASSGTNAAELRHLGICEVMAELGPDDDNVRELVSWLLTARLK